MKNLKLTKGLITLSSAALVAALTVALPATAQAADTCVKTTVLSGTKSVSVELCWHHDFILGIISICAIALFNRY